MAKTASTFSILRLFYIIVSNYIKKYNYTIYILWYITKYKSSPKILPYLYNLLVRRWSVSPAWWDAGAHVLVVSGCLWTQAYQQIYLALGDHDNPKQNKLFSEEYPIFFLLKSESFLEKSWLFWYNFKRYKKIFRDFT